MDSGNLLYKLEHTKTFIAIDIPELTLHNEHKATETKNYYQILVRKL
jgi:hypothetical protein